ncbi:MAG: CehA/McbA family metallohydrolase [Meiothermus sp.]|nr:CehA/McbA family metallohydrolase [Meiothermus sp.]
MILKTAVQLSGTGAQRYREVGFELEPGVYALECRLRLEPAPPRARVDFILQDPLTFRAAGMTQDGQAQVRVATDGASPGAHPGLLPAGLWKLTLEPINCAPETQLHIEVAVSRQPRTILAPRALNGSERVIRPEAGWYRGELHAHSNHSSGRDRVGELVAAAFQNRLDFLSLTDHNTDSGWEELEQAQTQHSAIALIRGCELTTALGHANLHGLSRWIDPTVANHPALERVFGEVRKQDALLCINHPFSNNAGWQFHFTDWAKVDLLEVYHRLEYAHNTLQLAFWDGLLNQGYWVVGVGATDTKNASQGTHRLGQVLTYVYADELSPQGILRGLKRGQVYVSLGPRLEFSAESQGQVVPMFGLVATEVPTQFRVSLHDLDGPAVVYLLKNGLFFDAEVFKQPTQSVVFTDTPEAPCQYRLEVHRLLPTAPNGYDRRQRSWETFLACSNPIFAGATWGDGRWKPV